VGAVITVTVAVVLLAQSPYLNGITAQGVIRWRYCSSADYWLVSNDGLSAFSPSVGHLGDTKLLIRNRSTAEEPSEVGFGELRSPKQFLVGSSQQIKRWRELGPSELRAVTGVPDEVFALKATTQNQVTIAFRSTSTNLAQGLQVRSGVTTIALNCAITVNEKVFVNHAYDVEQAVADRASSKVLVELKSRERRFFCIIEANRISSGVQLPHNWSIGEWKQPGYAQPLLLDLAKKLVVARRPLTPQVEVVTIGSKKKQVITPPKKLSDPEISGLTLLPSGDLLISYQENQRSAEGSRKELGDVLYRVKLSNPIAWKECGKYRLVGNSVSGYWLLVRDAIRKSEWLLHVKS
jgi:hypothetical protein